MSDRRNRDIGRKILFRKEHGKWFCDCWQCTNAAEKKRTLLDRANTKQKIRQSVLNDIDEELNN